MALENIVEYDLAVVYADRVDRLKLYFDEWLYIEWHDIVRQHHMQHYKLTKDQLPNDVVDDVYSESMVLIGMAVYCKNAVIEVD